MAETLNIYRYLDYRSYLKAYYEVQKGLKRHFSHRYFARIAGLSSSGYLKMVMDGDRNLSPASIAQFVKALRLGRREAAYFEALVLFNQAKGDEERDQYFERLCALRPRLKLTGLEKDRYEYYTKAHFVVIRELTALPHFQEDPAWIARHLSFEVRLKDVEHAIATLIRLGLLCRDHMGKLRQAEGSLTTPAEVDSAAVYKFQQDMLSEAKQAMLTVPASDRDITSLTIPIPKPALKKLKEKIKCFREEIIDFINKGSEDYHEVYQVNIQLFPVTKTKAAEQ